MKDYPSFEEEIVLDQQKNQRFREIWLRGTKN